MTGWLWQLDRLLRGESTRLDELRSRDFQVPVGGLAAVAALLAVIYGVCMGSYAAFSRELTPAIQQLLATALKVPALFLLTLVVTFPSLYVFNALVGSQLKFLSVLRLLVASLAVNATVLASLGPIVAFFSVCTTSYPFMVLLNVAVFAASGALGLGFLLQTLHRLTVADRPEPPLPKPPAPASAENASPAEGDVVPAVVAEAPGPLDRYEGHVLGRHTKKVFACWMFLFGLVGAQMGWVLRPFIGDPGLPFEWFRTRESNFFEAVLRALASLLS